MKAVGLVSGGLDSTYSLYRAVREGDVVVGLTFNYRQKAATSEIKAAAKVCQALGIKHEVLDLLWLGGVTKTALVNPDFAVPGPGQVNIDSLSASQDTAQAVWVPNRNGVFINVAAAFAESLGAGYIITGFNREEAATFADNSADFLNAINHSLSFSTRNGVKVKSYCIAMDKRQIVAGCRDLNVPLEYVWSCYLAGEKPCGQCESCQRLKRALEVNDASVSIS